MRRPEEVWFVDEEYQSLYDTRVSEGSVAASQVGVNIVAIARNAMPSLTNTLALVGEVGSRFASRRAFIFENDSTDDTASALDGHAARNEWFSVRHETWGGEDFRGFSGERTERLAKARNICLDWVRENGSESPYTIVVDLDPDYGFSVDGVFNSLGWIERVSSASVGGMASYSLYKITDEKGGIGIAHYDAWAARLNWWRDRRNEDGGTSWFSMFLPPVGSPPIPMNSAFGGLCVYRTEAFLSGGYSGEDCEHVPHHRRMALAGYEMFLNPGCRYIAVWK